MRLRHLLPIIPWFLFGCAGLQPRPISGFKSPIIRVLLASNRERVRITATGTYKIQLKGGKFPIRRIGGGRPLQFIASRNDNSLLIKDITGKGYGSFYKAVMIIPIDPQERVIFDDNQYRGRLELSVNGKGRIIVINTLNLEDYLKGVIGGEMGEVGKEGYEALKAQAVASRTYALRKLQTQQDALFDIKATVQDQFYGGYLLEKERSNKAVEETRGLILIYHGEPIYALYHSTCGGRREKGGDVWPELDFPYLKEGIDNLGWGTLCQDSPNFRWIEEWRGEQLDRIIKRALVSMGVSEMPASGEVLKDIRILNRFHSGRVKKLLVEFSSHQYTFVGEQIRRVLRRPDGSLLRSTLFKLQILRDTRGRIKAVMAIGLGNGHGVGMCQWGAIGMAKRGYRFDQILRYYYPGTLLRRLY